MKSWLINPVLQKEWKLRFRSIKGFLGVLFYLLVMALFAFGFLIVATSFGQSSFITPEMSQSLFALLAFIQLGLVLFISPSLTAGAISTEREKQTLSMLLTTTQTSGQIIFGKLASSISYLLLLLVAGIPIYSIVFLFGGVSPGELLRTFSFVVFTMIAFGSIGILCSTIFRRTIVATVTTYGLMLVAAVVTAFLALVVQAFNGFNGAQIGAVDWLSHVLLSLNPPAILFQLLGNQSDQMLFSGRPATLPGWLIYIAFYSLVIAVSLALAVRRLRKGQRNSR